ncbi:TatD family deoxyribonuclease [Labilibacter sediminis]|nr:TatD family deoxyribonuclease [Labilibacter sediminis]
MSVIDTHSHIYSDHFDEDRDEMVKRAFAAGVNTILMPNIDVESIDAMLEMEESYPNQCISMMGLHPTSVKDDYREQLSIMEAWLHKRKFCAIGEIGIDLYWDKTFIKEQLDAFKIQIDWAKKWNLPIVIHARDSFDEIFEVLDNINLEGVTGVFHSFTGNVEQAGKILSYGCFKLGVNGVVTFKNSGLDKVIGEFELEHFVLETDAPYLTPTPHRGKRNEPSYLQYIISKFIDVFQVSEQEIIEVTTKNAKELFRL